MALRISSEITAERERGSIPNCLSKVNASSYIELG